MKFSIRMAVAVIVFAAMIVGASMVRAQSSTTATTDAALSAGGLSLAGGYGDDYRSGYVASTPAEGFFRGLADGVRSLGLGYLLSSQGDINEAEARRREILNDRLNVETYFANRQTNREQRAIERGPRPTADDYARYARMDKPRLLSPSELDPVTGEIAWPILLRSQGFDLQRRDLDQIFSHWATSGLLGYNDFLRIRQTTGNMLDLLRDQIRVLPPSQYMVAVRFLESMTFEAGQPSLQIKGATMANVAARRQPLVR